MKGFKMADFLVFVLHELATYCLNIAEWIIKKM